MAELDEASYRLGMPDQAEGVFGGGKESLVREDSG